MSFKVRIRTHRGSNGRITDVRSVTAGIIGTDGPIEGVSYTFVTREKDDFIACQRRSKEADFRRNHLTLVRGTKQATADDTTNMQPAA